VNIPKSLKGNMKWLQVGKGLNAKLRDNGDYENDSNKSRY